MTEYTRIEIMERNPHMIDNTCNNMNYTKFFNKTFLVGKKIGVHKEPPININQYNHFNNTVLFK